MNAMLISNQRAGDQRKNDDQDDPLFVFGKNENPEEALHFLM
jgi:hypothetical protein